MKKTFRSVFALILLGAVCYILPSCNVSTANLSDIKLCSSVNSSGECDGDNSTFSGTVPVIYCSAQLKNAPSGTKVTFEWKQGSESMGKADVETSSGVVNSTFKPTSAMEPGTYSVTVKINTDNSKPVTKEFTITE